MKNVFIIHAHWNNRGDEAAVRVLIDQLLKNHNLINLQIISSNVNQFPYTKKEINLIPLYPRFRQIPDFILGILSKGNLVFSKEGKYFFKTLKSSDIIIHAPGGPCIGDTYSISEILYLLRYFAILRMNKKFIIYAPSMGPFSKKFRNIFRKIILKSAEKIILREDISKKYLDKLLPQNKAIVTLDAAFQNEIDVNKYKIVLEKDEELYKFFNTNKKIIGITITDLLWHPILSNARTAQNISNTFKKVIEVLCAKNYKILFIPQLFGEANDYNLMKTFEIEDCYTMKDTYDCYFQQFIISKIYAIIGMRYHSNIFSAKMGIPFISISYEQKMLGFMKKVNLNNYCIPLEQLNSDIILSKFEFLEKNYSQFKDYLNGIHNSLKENSFKSTKILLDYLNSNKI